MTFTWTFGYDKFQYAVSNWLNTVGQMELFAYSCTVQCNQTSLHHALVYMAELSGEENTMRTSICPQKRML